MMRQRGRIDAQRERRLLYVAMPRARELLWISSAGRSSAYLSRWVDARKKEPSLLAHPNAQSSTATKTRARDVLPHFSVVLHSSAFLSGPFSQRFCREANLGHRRCGFGRAYRHGSPKASPSCYALASCGGRFAGFADLCSLRLAGLLLWRAHDDVWWGHRLTGRGQGSLL